MMNIPVNVKVKGIVKRIALRDSRTNLIVEERKIKKNMLLTSYLDGIFTDNQRALLNWVDYGKAACSDDYRILSPMRICVIGDGTAAPSREDTQLINQLASTAADDSLKNRSNIGDDPAWVENTYIFSAGDGTGTINEIGIGSDESALTSRKVLDTSIQKESYHQLEITWKLELSRSTGIFSGIIEGGQRDGETDITWEATINDEQFYVMCHDYHGTTGNSAYQLGTRHLDFNPFYYLFMDGSTLMARIGDSNTPTNIEDDSEENIKGTVLQEDIPNIQCDPYVSGSYTRTTRIGFDTGECNDNLAEISIGTYNEYNTSYARGIIFRVTFTPALDKVDGYKLHIDITVNLMP